MLILFTFGFLNKGDITGDLIGWADVHISPYRSSAYLTRQSLLNFGKIVEETCQRTITLQFSMDFDCLSRAKLWQRRQKRKQCKESLSPGPTKNREQIKKRLFTELCHLGPFLVLFKRNIKKMKVFGPFKIWNKQNPIY